MWNKLFGYTLLFGECKLNYVNKDTPYFGECKLNYVKQRYTLLFENVS